MTSSVLQIAFTASLVSNATGLSSTKGFKIVDSRETADKVGFSEAETAGLLRTISRPLRKRS